ncbi:DnaJ family domain-containing protein [Streptomyces sp. NPDC002577]
MTERKPPGVSFESWIDKQIREAEERGDFARLEGAGKPLPRDLESTHDELWWIKRKMAREGLSHLPPTLALRKEAEDARAAAAEAPSERVVRQIVSDINDKISEALRRPPPGPPLGLAPFDVEAVVREWNERRHVSGE